MYCMFSERMALTYSNCEPFLPLRDGDQAFVVKVYDGDSLTLAWKDSGNKSNGGVRIGCRIRGIDTPELRTSSPYEKGLALRAKDRLASKCLGRMVTIRSSGREKYGRVLADLSMDDCESVAQYMLENKDVCRPYDGGKKIAWVEI